MIWYLLYPFRGTSDAPVLNPGHPLRAAFTRYGRCVARHVVTTLLISVSVAAVLVYPFPFLYTNDFTNGASNLPHHVWTDAQPISETSGIEPDVVMRYIWVHGSYMQALNRDILLGALKLQDELLGPTVNFSPRQPDSTVNKSDITALELDPKRRDTFHIVNGLTDESWFFHSPLQYWFCDPNRIATDPNIIGTVNEGKTQPTSVNVTLRPSIVFSGKRFEDRQLVAADAVVITLIHRRNSPVGRIWQAKAQVLANQMADEWDVYPSDGASMRSQLYEFQFLPMTSQDTAFLTIAYTLTFIYFVISLSKLRAVKSRFGLVIAVMTQLVVSIMSSFTICAILKIDLSKIPRYAYPVVIFSMSLENIFRLINAVILTPPEDNTSIRMGHAFGETSHVAIASVAQNLLILWGLSQLVSPGVAAFCTFAAIAIIFDFFYLSTFFLTVLCVDVRRMELSDALFKVETRQRRSPSEVRARQTWLDALLKGKVALSTRIAGTIVMIGFVLIAQWHFFESDMVRFTLRNIFRAWRSHEDFKSPRPSSLLIGVHQARSPTSWLRLQDHETAREVINVIKPEAHSYIARVFDPLVFVKKGADRMPKAKERPLLPAVYDFARHQWVAFIVTVLVVAAAVRILMNYLLWDELADSSADGDDEEPLLSVKTLGCGHSLDVAMLSASSDGYVVSVGLDRRILVWDLKAGGASYVLFENGTNCISFPILAMCIDESSHWLALLTLDRVTIWGFQERQWGPSVAINHHKCRPEAFFFSARDESQEIPSIILVRRNGNMLDIRPTMRDFSSYVIPGDNVIVSVGALIGKTNFDTKVMTSSREGRVFCINRSEKGWQCIVVPMSLPLDREFISIVSLSELGYMLVVRTSSVDLIDAKSFNTLHTFRTDPIQPRSLKCFHSMRRQMQCGSVGLKFLTFAYLNAFTRDLVVQTYTPQHEGDSICFREPGAPVSKTCCRWFQTKETKRAISDPGVWETLPSGLVVGARKRTPADQRIEQRHPPPAPNTGIRRRRISLNHRPHTNPENPDDWEVWMLSQIAKGETWHTIPLCQEVEDYEHLFVTNLGHMVRVGRAAVAIGLSNVIKVIVVGHERFENAEDGAATGGLRSLASRRRNKNTTLRSRPNIASYLDSAHSNGPMIKNSRYDC